MQRPDFHHCQVIARCPNIPAMWGKKRLSGSQDIHHHPLATRPTTPCPMMLVEVTWGAIMKCSTIFLLEECQGSLTLPNRSLNSHPHPAVIKSPYPGLQVSVKAEWRSQIFQAYSSGRNEKAPYLLTRVVQRKICTMIFTISWYQ